MSDESYVTEREKGSSRGRRRSITAPPTYHPDYCGTSTGAIKHFKRRERLCEPCAEIHRQQSRRADLLKRGIGEFGKVPTREFVFDEPLTEWRLLQTKQRPEGTFISGPWFTKIRVPRGDLPKPDSTNDLSINFVNGSAKYQFHHRDGEFVYFTLDRKSVESWLDRIERDYS